VIPIFSIGLVFQQLCKLPRDLPRSFEPIKIFRRK